MSLRTRSRTSSRSTRRPTGRSSRSTAGTRGKRRWSRSSAPTALQGASGRVARERGDHPVLQPAGAVRVAEISPGQGKRDLRQRLLRLGHDGLRMPDQRLPHGPERLGGGGGAIERGGARVGDVVVELCRHRLSGRAAIEVCLRLAERRHRGGRRAGQLRAHHCVQVQHRRLGIRRGGGEQAIELRVEIKRLGQGLAKDVSMTSCAWLGNQLGKERAPR